MGASTARISATDFLTPPELCHLRLAADGAGRVGGVRLELTRVTTSTPFQDAGCATRLTGCYQQVPLRVVPAFQFGPGQPALLYLLNPTAGLMDGDGQLVCVHAGSGTRTVLVGQSATRIHPCLRGFSTQQWRIKVQAGAVLAVLPGPAIPFQDCRYYQRVDIELEKEAGLVWGDIWLAGRYAYGITPEQFIFGDLIQELTIHRDQAVLFRDRFSWQGPWDRDTAEWHFGGAPACGNLFITGPIHERTLHSTAAATMASFGTAHGDTCVRWCGDSESVTACVVRTALCAAAGLAGGAPSKPWLAAGHDLAPNHWFTL